MQAPFQVQFIGATGTVTGSKYLVKYDRYKLLIDCGLFQGIKNVRRRNWTELPFHADNVDAVLLTHAHIDHSGFLPALMKRGFHGPIYCSEGTHALCKVLLPDAGYLQEEDAKYANKKRFSKHEPAEALYTEDDARKVLKQFRHIATSDTLELPGGMTATFTPTGHILGACAIRLEYQGKSITFTGDVGRSNDMIMYPPKPLAATDYLVVESTYGNRLHEEIDAEQAIADVVNRTAARGGIVLMPAFAVGRAQLVIHILQKLLEQNRIPTMPVYLNSPMAIRATEIFFSLHDEHKLSKEDCEKMDHITHYVKTVEESIELNNRKYPGIIISASGMASGGRVLHHLKTLVGDARNSVLFLGYQAAGTRGDSLTNGADHIKIHGQYFPVKAEVANLQALSSHGDYREISDWLKKMPGKPTKVFITHGESCAADCMRLHLQDEFGWNVEVPEYLDIALL
ncbi:MBL fold metallo-hydrolase [Thalassolituus marinus]|uniref:MBL fold metallo-hydrolase n=1 Tax=Thalassolituus marinus TaxID=671053 RepID=A0ABS7ZSK0_9GAMM|nr:MBL fold metallo-hydrolase [Thalassolituus marinus]MCA6064585.1 MBL fold metallo-hydrolase [Thalassolituus marinus]